MLLIDGKRCSSLPHLNQIGIQDYYTKNSDFVIPQDENYGSSVRLNNEKSEWIQQESKREQELGMDRMVSSPRTRANSSPAICKKATNEDACPKRKSVRFSMDIENVDLLCESLPELIINHSESHHDELSVKSEPSFTKTPSFDRVMGFNNPDNATQQSVKQNFDRIDQGQQYNILNLK